MVGLTNLLELKLLFSNRMSTPALIPMLAHGCPQASTACASQLPLGPLTACLHAPYLPPSLDCGTAARGAGRGMAAPPAWVACARALAGNRPPCPPRRLTLPPPPPTHAPCLQLTSLELPGCFRACSPFAFDHLSELRHLRRLGWVGGCVGWRGWVGGGRACLLA